MSVQILLQGKLLGIEEFVLSAPAGDEGGSLRSRDEALVAARSRWVALLSEVLPRALLAELGLSKLLLGASGGGQFLLVLPEEARVPAADFLASAGRAVGEIGGGRLKLTWAVTENLGDWSVVRKRLNEEMQRKRGAPLAEQEGGLFEPFVPAAWPAPDAYFSRESAAKLLEADIVGWSPESPARIVPGEGKYTWALNFGASPDAIALARHVAMSDDGKSFAGLRVLAHRASGRDVWGVLRGDVDNVGIRLRRAQTIEEHVQLSVMYKQFFVGELEVLCSMPEFFRKVTVLYSGGDDFAVYGAWDALIPLAREMQRLFHRFSEENLKDFPGPEGKTISMALALAPEASASLRAVHAEAGNKLDWAKAANKHCIHLLGRALEWKQVADAADIKDNLTRMIRELGSARQFLSEIGGFYRKGSVPQGVQVSARGGESYFDKPWRIYRRFNRVLGGARDRDIQKLRAHFTSELGGRNVAQVKLRPAGLVALEWARLLIEG
jgi:CRISPR-associated protein Csm1